MSAPTRRLAREAALTLGAALGLLCVVTALAAPLFGIQLLVFKSGSMGPDMDTGALAISRTVDAADLAIGDVVSVTTSSGTRVTHRISGIVADGDQFLLELKGDANANPDTETYPVTEADRVVAHVNGLGYVVDALASPYAVFIAGAGAAGLLVLTFRRRNSGATPDEEPTPIEELTPIEEPTPIEETSAAEAVDPAPAAGGRARRIAVTATLALAVLTAGTATWTTVGGGTLVPTLASFSDTADVTAPMTALEVPAPSGDVECTNGGIFSGVVHLGWPAVADPPTGYKYRVDVYTTDPADPVATQTTTDLTAEIGRGELPDSGTFTVRVSGELDGSTWRSSDGATRTISAGGLGWEINC